LSFSFDTGFPETVEMAAGMLSGFARAGADISYPDLIKTKIVRKGYYEISGWGTGLGTRNMEIQLWTGFLWLLTPP
jgi:hypothetical protein